MCTTFLCSTSRTTVSAADGTHQINANRLPAVAVATDTIPLPRLENAMYVVLGGGRVGECGERATNKAQPRASAMPHTSQSILILFVMDRGES